MRRGKTVIVAACAVVCLAALVFISRGYDAWSEETFGRLLYENQEAYTRSQKAEIIAKVEDIRNSLKMLKFVLEECVQEEDIHRYDSAMEKISSAQETFVSDVSYISFGQPAAQEELAVQEKDMVEALKEGKSGISSVYHSDKDGEFVYEIAEPVRIGGVYTGYVRGCVESQVLIDTSQTGFLREDTESYILHRDGTSIFELGKKELNVIENVKRICDEPEKLDAIMQAVQNGSQETKAAWTTAEGEQIFMSCAVLPYNDWILFNMTSAENMQTYMNEMASGGRAAVFTVIITAALMIGIFLLLYYWNNKNQWFEQKRSSLLANFSDTVLCEYEVRKDRLTCTSNITRMLQLPDTAVEHFRKYACTSGLIHTEDLSAAKEALLKYPKEGEVREYELRLKNKDGEYQWYAIHLTAMYVKGKDKGRIILKITDIAEAKKEVQGLVQRAQKDVLTGLLNREAFAEQVTACLAQGKMGWLFLMDLDRFKAINDLYGHLAGDTALKKEAECIRTCFGETACSGRYGGDEFLVFLPEEEKARAEAYAERMCRMLQQIKIAEAGDTVLTCSIGIAWALEADYTALLKKADTAMYEVKQEGGNGWKFHQENRPHSTF